MTLCNFCPEASGGIPLPPSQSQLLPKLFLMPFVNKTCLAQLSPSFSNRISFSNLNFLPSWSKKVDKKSSGLARHELSSCILSLSYEKVGDPPLMEGLKKISGIFGVGGHFTITDYLKLLISLVRPSGKCWPTRIIQNPFHDM